MCQQKEKRLLGCLNIKNTDYWGKGRFEKKAEKLECRNENIQALII